MSKLGGDNAWCQVVFPKIKLVMAVKNYAEALIKVFCSCPVLPFISLLCSKYFVQDCRLYLHKKESYRHCS